MTKANNKKGVSTVNKAITVSQVEEYVKSLGDRKDRDSIHGWEKRSAERKAINEMIESGEKLYKELKDADPKQLDAERKKAQEKELADLNKSIKKMAAAGREFGRIDSITIINGVVNIGMSAAGGAIAAHVTDGDYFNRILSNTIACSGVDAISEGITRYLTGIYGSEDWQRYAHKGVKFVLEVGGAAGASALISHYALGKDPIEAAITAAATQVGKRGLEWVRNAIMEG